MSNVLFVVHRGAPFPGGSEYYVHAMAVACTDRGMNSTVLAHEHQGPYDGIPYVNDYSYLTKKWDLIVVHGGDCISQNVTHYNAAQIKSPVCYMIIKPSDSAICQHGMKYHRILSYSTTADYEHIKKYGYLEKARRIRHGVVLEDTLGDQIYDYYPGKKHTFVSAGGFWPNKAMVPLAEAFEKTELGELHIYGYDANSGPIPKQTDKVKIIIGATKKEVMNAVKSADAYIQNSTEEGFGLVLLEAMLNKTPWFARDIAGASDMKDYGVIYRDENDLLNKLALFNTPEFFCDVEGAYEYALSNHTIKQTVDDIECLLWEIKGFS